MQTRPISFRVPQEVLDAIEGEGRSPTQVAKEALEREARLARTRATLAKMTPSKVRLERDARDIVREERDRR